MTNKEQELIDYVLDTFDFAKVFRVMTLLDWKWRTTNSSSPSMEVPSEYELRQAVRKTLKSAIDGNTHSDQYDHYMFAIGGFEYHIFREHGEVVFLEVKFVITCADADVNYFGE